MITIELYIRTPDSLVYKIWHKHERRHRTDGPAVISSTGYKAWYRNGLYQRNNMMSVGQW